MEPFQYPKPAPPDPEAIAAQQANVDRMREQWKREAQANDHWKRFLLLAGPPLRDLDAAMACNDPCHPRVRMEHHDGGQTCHCQDTPEERAARRQRARDALSQLTSVGGVDPEAEAERRFRRDSFAKAARDLGVDVEDWGGWAPFQITASVGGRSFYVRSRHQHFRIEVAPESDPEMLLRDDAWSEQWVIDEGSEETLFGGSAQDEVYALKYSVAKVKAFLSRPVPCPHVLTNEAGTIQFAYCPLCGFLLQHITGIVQ